MAGVLCSMLGAVPPSPVGGTSIYFDGSGDYISARGMGAHAGYPMTIEMWIYPASTTINGLFDSAPNTAGGIRNWGANVAAVQGQEGTGATFTVSANVWQHIAFVYDDGSIKVYVNGTLNASGTFSTAGFSWAYFGHEAANNGTMNFGTINNGLTSYNGYMDEIRVSNVVRYSSNFTAPTTRFTDDANTVVLIHGTGTNGSTTFTDDKTASRTASWMAAAGNAQISTAQSKFGGSSALFDGTRDSIFVASNVGPSGVPIALGTGQFTIECWVRFNTLAGTNQFSGGIIHSLNYWTLYVYNNKFYFGRPGVANDLIQSTSIVTNTWYHVAVTRNSSNTINLWVDGVSRASASNFTSNFLADLQFIGFTHSVYTVMNGYIDELRISKTARYTAGFTPSASAFTSDANTLLLCHFDGSNGSKSIVDDARPANTKTCVAVGNVAISDAQSKFTSSPRTAKTITASGNAQVSTAQSKFGGASALFDGNGDLISTVTSSDFSFGTGDFTIELWVYATASPATGWTPIITLGSSGGGKEIRIGQNMAGSGYGFLMPNATNTSDLSYAVGTLSLNSWQHLALVRDGSNLKLYNNGTQVQSQGCGFNFTDTGGIKIAYGVYSGDGYYTGYVDEVRVSNKARYTTNFTAPTAAFTNDANTLMLLHCDGANASTTFTDDTA